MQPYDIHKWFTPRFAIEYLASQLDKHGKIVLHSNKFKKEREAWILGLALLGINKLTGRLWWLQVPEIDPPDMRAMSLASDKESNHNMLLHREIEIAQITNHTDNTIVDEILNKLKGKQYIKETCLVVYMTRNENIDNIYSLADALIGKTTVSDIWIVGAIEKDSPKHILFSVVPDVKIIEFNIIEEMSKIPEGDQIMLTRAKGTSMTLYKNMPLSEFIPSK